MSGDFDGDGTLDVAISSPEHDCGKGRVYVRGTSGSVAIWHRDTNGILGTAACSDNFGAALAAADVDSDGYDDLVIGAPGATDPGVSDAGAVHVIYGSSSGLTATGDQLWHQNSTGIQGVAEVGDFFGDSLTTGDFDCDGYSDLVIGVPREAISTNDDAGAVHVLYGSSGGLTSVNDLYYQGTGGVNGVAEEGDQFGASLAAGNIDGDQAAGIDCDDLAIGAPGEDLGAGQEDAGYLYLIYGDTAGLSTTGDQAFHQDVAGIVDAAELDDRFADRLAIVDANGDGFADIVVTVPGDGCAGPSGWGRHILFGSSGGIVTTGNSLDCDTFGCDADGDDLLCEGAHAHVYASPAANRLSFMFGDDVASGGSGDDEFRVSLGDDVIFGGPGADAFHAGGGRDIFIGGTGDDTFTVDLDCEAEAGDVIDGGPGTDTVYSHRTQTELRSMGVVFAGIEQFVLVSSDPDPAGLACNRFSYFSGAATTTSVELSWQELPDPDSIHTTTSGVLHLLVVNTSAVAVTAQLSFVLRAREEISTQEPSPLSLAAFGQSGDRAAVDLDLNDFIPSGVDPQTVDPELLELPVSASLLVGARVSVGTLLDVESAHAMPLFGHLEGGDTAVIYGPLALRTDYNGGDLAHLTSPPQQQSTFAGFVEAHGSRGIPPKFQDP